MGIDPGTNYMGYGVVEVDGKRLRCIVMGVIDLHRMDDPYQKLLRIFDRVGAIIDEYAPRDVALEAPFFGENVQSMLKLGRAQGVAMSAALSRGVDVFEYAPTRIKQAVAGRGSASKEQLAQMVTSILKLEDLHGERLDATDGVAAALCHYYAESSPLNGKFAAGRNKGLGGGRKELTRKGSTTWEAYLKANPERESGIRGIGGTRGTGGTEGRSAAKRSIKKPVR